MQEPLHLLERYVPDLTSPVQAGPIASMLTGAAVPPAQLEGLMDAFASALKQLSGDGRSFSATISGQSDAAAIEALASTGGRQRINSLPVLDAWRSYLVRHLGGSVCGDLGGAGSSAYPSVTPPLADPAYSGPLGAVRYFNENMRTGALPAISDQEVQPANLDSQARVIGPCESVECRQLSTQFGGLVLGPAGMAYTEEQKASPEWAGKLREYMESLSGWKTADDPAEYFLWKAHYYSDLFHVLPNGANRDIVLSGVPRVARTERLSARPPRRMVLSSKCPDHIRFRRSPGHENHHARIAELRGPGDCVLCRIGTSASAPVRAHRIPAITN